MTNYYIFRNFTLETYFSYLHADYSPYGDLSFPSEKYSYYIWFYHPPFKANIEELVNEIDDYKNKINLLVSNLPKNSTLILFQLDTSLFFSLTLADSRLERVICYFNDNCRQLSEKSSNIKSLSFADFSKQYSLDHLIDWKYYYLSQINFNPKLALDFKKWFNHQLNAIKGIRKKCLILDLDNTLWGGVLGEDGIYGIQIGNTYPASAFRDFQLDLLEAAKQGIILTICSKNNEADVLEAWEKNSNIILRKEHFSAWRINWNNKHENIIELAAELNIGLDGCLFIDDNPIERELVKNYIPEVIVPDFPKSPYLLHDFFIKLYKQYFYSYQLTNEDKNKTAQYIENKKRMDNKKAFDSIEDYWKSLQMVIVIDSLSEENITRIVQMTQKTNQFNLTTQRYNNADLVNIIENNGLVYCLSVKDKFGDNGITALCIIKIKNTTAIIDSYLLSCRILGRGIENVFIKSIINILYNKGIKIINSSYIPSLKNKQVEIFYEKIGFELVDKVINKELLDENEKNYIFKISHPIEVDDYCKVKINDR